MRQTCRKNRNQFRRREAKTSSSMDASTSRDQYVEIIWAENIDECSGISVSKQCYDQTDMRSIKVTAIN